MTNPTPNDHGPEDTTAAEGVADAGQRGSGSGVLADALEKLREPFNAWVSAGAALGPLVGELGDRLREDLRNVGDRDEKKSAGDRVEDTAEEARKAAEDLGDADSVEDAKKAVSGFAATAESTIRDLSGSVRNAAGQTRDTEAAQQARTAFQEAVDATRRAFDEAVEALRDRSGDDDHDNAAKNASTVDEVRNAVDNLVARAGEVVRDLKNTGGERIDDLRTRVQASGSEKSDAADIIDGEVINEDDDTETGK
ncbi:CGLAU_01105 family protein [Corynebacterium sp. CCM 8835]|uniref:CGLAU_01105 family protein n=1 Tax=Corynebacterium antarcticum TaxID=2800405 RepID=A0A9Q4CCR4_9CORY|nr:CGLAU_01105 family protein [Corynebacterium antarcticum]MCK7642468.1 CGLAU_01105 family protein [Corynebacterium antarcticum]MCK7660847.1 CGLAU_01105 family protein [Corynebacterium antarcticum]MCL0245594.1 CGLAU_01105 family protein [Corynebacterium antarcticum]MCX7491949.1 CGLAU_01105 family protein [Corynebacterium antarcticum]MCX7538003.1 CGLAU_01105 family protein [Corynebacterium antarcticum]